MHDGMFAAKQNLESGGTRQRNKKKVFTGTSTPVLVLLMTPTSSNTVNYLSKKPIGNLFGPLYTVVGFN